MLTVSFLVWAFSGQWRLAFIVGVVEVFAKGAMYFIHERLWTKIPFGQKAIPSFVVWFTGFPSAGKTTLASALHDEFLRSGLTVEHLDGDIIRELFPKTGFSKEERDTHIRRVGLLASILERNNVVVLCSFISPYEESRQFVRRLCRNFCEVYVNAPLDVCESRDVKGLYQQARSGIIKGFTGIDDPYEVPRSPEITVYTDRQSVRESLDHIRRFLHKRYFK